MIKWHKYLILNLALFSLHILQCISLLCLLYNINIIDRFYNVHASDLLTWKLLQAFSTRSASLSWTLKTTRTLWALADRPESLLFRFASSSTKLGINTKLWPIMSHHNQLLETAEICHKSYRIYLPSTNGAKRREKFLSIAAIVICQLRTSKQFMSLGFSLFLRSW